MKKITLTALIIVISFISKSQSDSTEVGANQAIQIRGIAELRFLEVASQGTVQPIWNLF